MLYFVITSIVFLMTIFLTLAVRNFARRFKVVDQPLVGGRKIHKKPVPLLGGFAIYLAIVSSVGVVLIVNPEWLTVNMSMRQLVMVGLGGLIIMIGGIIDDIHDLKPSVQILFPILAILLVFSGGIELVKITNPLGGVLRLDRWRIGSFMILGDIIVFAWLLGMTYTTKLLDGLDGLATGVVGIGALMIFALSTFTKFYQPDVALLALIIAAACAAFLIFNFHPASIFLGEGGSLFLGFMLGVLAIIAGGKIATTLLVMGVAILDVAWVILRRLWQKKKVSMADAGHLHHRLLRAGFSHRRAVLFLYMVSAAFGSLTLVLQSKYKLLALAALALFVAVLGVWLVMRSNNIKTSSWNGT